MLFIFKALNPQLLPRRHSKNVCVFTTHGCVCALGWDTRRAQIQSLGYHTWPKVKSFYKDIFFNTARPKKI